MQKRSFIDAPILKLAYARILEGLDPLADLLSRMYLAHVFLLSGWSKISDWNSTLFLFTEEYHVPLLPPFLAATLGTLGELCFGTMLLLGVYTQFSALGLFTVNLVAVIAYYSELSSTPAAIHDHMEWGLLIALIAVRNRHPWSIDRLVSLYWRHDGKAKS